MRPLPMIPLTLALAACSGPSGEPVDLLDYRAVVPPGLEARTPSSSMRLAEFAVPRDDGAEAEIVVFYFGPGQGGSVEANIARWGAQFTGPDGGPVAPKVTVQEGVSFPTTIAEFEGAYARGVGIGDAPSEPDQGLVAAVVETPSGSLFLQLFGDRTAVADTRADFLRLVGSIEPR